MYIGIPNPNILVPLEKMTIEPEGGKSFQVLYNPESYTQSREVRYAQSQGISTNTPVVQFAGGGAESIQFKLFFDSMSSGSEVGGGVVDKAKFLGNSLLPSIGKLIDVRKVYEMTSEGSIQRELVLIKLRSDEETRTHLVEIGELFKAKVIDVTPSTLTMQITGSLDKLDSFLELVRPYGIVELVRTGMTALERGSRPLSETTFGDEG